MTTEMSSLITNVKFYNGFECPALGFGTYRGKGNEIYQAVKHAIKIGYRHIDTAFLYENEIDVGRAINDSIVESDVSREELFIVTKLSNACNRPSLVVPALKQSLKNLGLNYVDLYLIHTPVSLMPLGNDVVSIKGKLDEKGQILFEDINPVNIWEAMENCVDLGLVKCIGVSNFNSQQVQAVLDSCKIKPVTNQVECHPFLPQTKLREFCENRGIVLTSFRAVGGQVRRANHPSILEQDIVKKLADKYHRSPAQILLRWQIQQKNNIVLVKSCTPERIESNTKIFDFILCEEDMQDLAKLECSHRYCPFLDSVSSKQYPFHIEY